ncbi:hypothetical protein LXL04_022339 [Taraxacum kok-saghyz]
MCTAHEGKYVFLPPGTYLARQFKNKPVHPSTLHLPSHWRLLLWRPNNRHGRRRRRLISNEDDEVQFDDVENNDSNDNSDDNESHNSARSSSHFSSRQWPHSYNINLLVEEHHDSDDLEEIHVPIF